MKLTIKHEILTNLYVYVVFICGFVDENGDNNTTVITVKQITRVDAIVELMLPL